MLNCGTDTEIFVRCVQVSDTLDTTQCLNGLYITCSICNGQALYCSQSETASYCCVSTRTKIGYIMTLLATVQTCLLLCSLKPRAWYVSVHTVPALRLLFGKAICSVYRDTIFWCSQRMWWAGHVERIGLSRSVFRVLVREPEGKRPLGRHRYRWEENIKMDIQDVGCGGRGM